MRKAWAIAGSLAVTALVLGAAGGAAPVPALAAADTQPPVTTALFEPAAPDGWMEWYVTPVKVALQASDDGAVAQTVYRLNGGDWAEYTEPFTIATEGRDLVLEYRSVDTAGNTEAPRAQTLSLDLTAPVVEIQSPAPGIYQAADSFRLEFSARDDLSGLWMTDAYLDGLPVDNHTTINLQELGPGEHLLEVFAVDLASHEAVATVIFQVGVSLPGLCDLTTGYGETGDIRTPLLLGRLMSRCRQAADFLAQSDYYTTDKLLVSFTNDVRRGIALGNVAPGAGAMLVREAENLREQLSGTDW